MFGGEKRPPEASKNTLYCSFCGKSQHEVKKLIAAYNVFICDECVELCAVIVKEEPADAGMIEAMPTTIDGACQHLHLRPHSGGFYWGCDDCHQMWAIVRPGQPEYGVDKDGKPVGAAPDFTPTMKLYNDERDTRVAPTKP